MRKQIISWLSIIALLSGLCGCKAMPQESAAPDVEISEQQAEEELKQPLSTETDTPAAENPIPESSPKEPFQWLDDPLEPMTVEHHQPKCLDLQVITPSDKTALLALFNQKEWQNDAMDLYPALNLYIGDRKLGYAPGSGALTMYGEGAHSVELGDETAKKVNEILGKYLFLYIDQEYAEFSRQELYEIDSIFAEERWEDQVADCYHTCQFPYQEQARKAYYSFGWKEDGSLCGCFHRISEEGVIQQLLLSEWEEEQLLPLLEKYKESNRYPADAYLNPGKAAVLAREYGATVFGEDMARFELLRVEPANGGIWWRVYFRSRYGKDAFVQGPTVSFNVVIADGTVTCSNLDSEDYSDFDSSLLEGLSYETVIAPEENRLKAEYGDRITDYHEPYARLVKEDGVYKLEYSFLFHADDLHYERTHYYELT